MRRSSWIAIISAVVILGLLGALLIASSDTQAPTMTSEVAQTIIERGRKAMESGDVEGVIALMAPNAKILEGSPDQIRPLLEQAVKELGKSKLDIKCGPPEVKTERGIGLVSFDMDVGEHRGNMDVHYYHTRLDLELEKVSIPIWMGLRHAQEWRIIQLDSSQSLDVPPQ